MPHYFFVFIGSWKKDKVQISMIHSKFFILSEYYYWGFCYAVLQGKDVWIKFHRMFRVKTMAKVFLKSIILCLRCVRSVIRKSKEFIYIEIFFFGF